eukprot:896092_1
MSQSAVSPKPKPTSSVNETAAAVVDKDKDGALNVRLSFRSFASSLIVAARQAEKVAAAGGPVAGKASPAAGAAKATDPLEEAVDMILKSRQAVRRTATLLEEQLRGNAKESEALHCCLRSQPCVGGR